MLKNKNLQLYFLKKKAILPLKYILFLKMFTFFYWKTRQKYWLIKLLLVYLWSTNGDIITREHQINSDCSYKYIYKIDL